MNPSLTNRGNSKSLSPLRRSMTQHNSEQEIPNEQGTNAMDDTSATYYPPPPVSTLPSSYYPSYDPPPPPAPPPAFALLPPLAPLPPYIPPRQPIYPSSSYLPSLYNPPSSSQDLVRTLFIGGLPEDVKAREIYNLFREFPGYESSHLRSTGTTSQSDAGELESQTRLKQPFAFAVFFDQQSAIAAMRTLNGLVFDLEKGSTLHIELAKANSRSKRLKADDDRHSLDKRMRGSGSYSEGTFEDGVSSVHFPGMSNSAYNTSGYPSNQSLGNSDGVPLNEKAIRPILKPLEPHAPQNNPPCPTIFVANLGHTCTELELMNVFSRRPGFIKLKTQSRFGAPVAFIDFQDTASSTAALNQLQGTVLYSSPSGIGMRLEYAKSRMGQRKRK